MTLNLPEAKVMQKLSESSELADESNPIWCCPNFLCLTSAVV
jgi:hypothetical protein